MKNKLIYLVLLFIIFSLSGCKESDYKVTDNQIDQKTEENINEQHVESDSYQLNNTADIIELITRTFDNGEYNVVHIDKDHIYAKNYTNIESSILYESSDWIDFKEITRFDNIHGRFYVNPFLNTEIFFVSEQVKGESGIWFSSDSGVTWTKVLDKPIAMFAFCYSNKSYYALSIDYHNNSTTVYKSNNQVDWVEKSRLKDEKLINYFTVNPYDENQILLATREGLLYTADEGSTWSYLTQDGEIIDALFTEINDDIYFTTSSGHIYLYNKTNIVEVMKPDGLANLRTSPQTLTLRYGYEEIYLILTSGVEDYLIRINNGKIDDEFRYYINSINYRIKFNYDDSNELYLLEPNGVMKMTLNYNEEDFLPRMEELFEGWTIEELNQFSDRARQLIESRMKDGDNQD